MVFKKKLASQENVQDIDRYYVTIQLIGDQNPINFYQTPLHAAIERGNVRAVSLLLSLGADKNKKITVAPNKKDIAHESGSYSVMVSVLMTSDEKLNQKRIAEFKDSLSVNLSALEFAQKLLKQKKEADIFARKEICKILEDC
jgi:ankyrin repeat protein